MSYSQFKRLTEVTKKFGLSVKTQPLFLNLMPVIASDYLNLSLKIAEKMGYVNEKERSERLVNPILAELLLANDSTIVIYSGRDLYVDEKQGLNGECDFLISRQKVMIDDLIAPIISIVEAKEQDLRYGVAHCAAQLYGAKLFNEAEGLPQPQYYGAATTGEVWRFLRLKQNELILDTHRYSIFNLSELLGVLQFIVADN
jgi:hypothetical protein